MSSLELVVGVRRRVAYRNIGGSKAAASLSIFLSTNATHESCIPGDPHKQLSAYVASGRELVHPVIFSTFLSIPSFIEFLEQVLGASPSPGRNVLVQKKQSHSILNSLPCNFNKCQNMSNSKRFHDLVITLLNSGLLGLSLRTPNMQFDVFLSITDW